MLAKIFAAHRAPLAGWGRDLEIPPVVAPAYKEAYLDYVNRYLKSEGLQLRAAEFDYLLTEVQGIPESINIVCNYMLRRKRQPDSVKTMELIIRGAVEERSSRFEEMIARLRPNERAALTAVAKFGPVKQIKGKEFLHQVRSIAPTSLLHAMQRLEDLAEIYREEQGHVVAEPLLGLYLKHIR